MRIKIIIIVLYGILVNVNLAQETLKIGTPVHFPLLLSNMQFDAFNSIGFSNITKSQISEIGGSNPANLAVVFWDSFNDIYKDQLDFSASTQINLTENYHKAFGIFLTDRILEEEYKYFHNQLSLPWV